MSQVSTTRRRRLNYRALIALTVLLALGVPGLLGLRSLQTRRGKATFLREARAKFEKKDPAAALTYVNRFLEFEPANPEALDLKSLILHDSAVTEEQLSEAAQVHVRVLGLSGDPASESRLATRRRLIQLSLKIPGFEQAAEDQARELVRLLKAKGGPEAIDAPTHRLLAEALENATGIASDEAKRAALIEEARTEYETAERLAPGDVEGAVRLAALYHSRLNDDAKAAAVLDRAVAATASQPKANAQALLARAQFVIETGGDSETAEADLDKALAVDPENPEVRMTAARAALKRRDTLTARKHLQAIPESFRSGLNYRLLEGLIALTDRQPEEAIRTWRAGLVESGGANAELTWRLAQILLEVGRIEEARTLIEQCRRLEGEESPRYRYLVGLAHLKSNQPNEAIREFEAVRYKIDPMLESQLQYALGQAYEGTRNTAKALEAYQRATVVSRDWNAPWLAAASLELATDPAQAKATLRKGLALNPTDSRLLGSLARLLWSEQLKLPLAERRWAEVERILADARKFAPGDPDVALIQAEYLGAIGKPEEALGLLEAAAKLRPEAPELWLALASAAVRRTELGEALNWLDQGIAAAGPQAGFFITRATILVMKGDVTKGRDALVEGLQKCPSTQHPLLWKTLGELYQARRDLPSARAAFQAWAKLQPENPDPWIALVLVAIDEGDEANIASAIESIRKVTGEKSHYWRYVRFEDLLRDRENEPPDPARDAKRLDEAEKLVDEIRRDDPQPPLGLVLRGRLLQARGKIDEAIAAYREAVERNGGAAALNPLLALLVKEKREGDLDRLRQSYPGGPVEFDRLAAVQALRAGDKDRAEQLAAMAAQGDPQGVDLQTWRAEVLQALGKPEEAERALAALVERKPAEPAPWLKLLMLQVVQGRKAEALATVDRMRSKVKTDYPELLWAQCYRAAGDFARANESYDAALRRWPNDLGVTLSAVGFFQQSGQLDRADAVLRSVLAKDPSNALAKRKLAESLASRTGNREAWTEALKIIGPETQPDDLPDDLMTRAKIYAQSSAGPDRRKAIAILENLVAELPGLDPAHDLLARLLYAEGEKSKALDQIAKVANGPRPTPDAVLFLAALLLERNDLDAAEVQIDRLARSAPDSLPVAELRSRVLAARGKLGEAAAPLESAFAALPEGPSALDSGTKIVRALLGVNQVEAAERVARKLAESSTRGRCMLAELLASQGKSDEAAAELETAAKAGDPASAGGTALTLAATRPTETRWLDLADRHLGQAVEKSPGSVPLLEKIALVRHLQNRYEDEISTYKSMIEKNPANFLFLNNMAWTLAIHLGKPDQAIDWADQAVAKAGPKPEILDTRGVILTRLNRTDEAIRDLEAAVAESPSPSFLFHLALAYQKKGDLDQARVHRDRALEAGFTPTGLQEPERADWDAVKDL
ncbi:MAG: tetratricopeptide repeat protein [Isosphaeraceae bacterium]